MNKNFLNKKYIIAGIVVLLLLSIFIFSSKYLSVSREDEFIKLMQNGRNYLERGEFSRALEVYKRAVNLVPINTDIHINLAICYLGLNQASNAIVHAQKAIELDDKIAAPYYITGCAFMRLGKPKEAIKMFQLSINLDPTVAASYYHLGRAHLESGEIEDAIAMLQTAIEMEENHPSAHYLLAQAYSQINDKESAEKELQIHQKIRQKLTNEVVNIDFLERCKLLAPRMPFKPELPSRKPIQVIFADGTAEAFRNCRSIKGPAAVIDFNHDGRNSIFAYDGKSFRVFSNTNGVFYPMNNSYTPPENGEYVKCLVGDIQNDRFEDVIVLGKRFSHVFRFATNAQFTEVTGFCGLKGLTAVDGVLADLDFTGALDLVIAEPTNKSVRIFQNLKNFYFKENTTNAGIAYTITGIERIIIDDRNGDELPDLLLSRKTGKPILYEKRRGGIFYETNLPPNFPAGEVLAVGDFNNDLKSDAVILNSDGSIIVYFGESYQPARLNASGFKCAKIIPFDYDNDGWLDILAIGNGIRLWRFTGNGQFEDVTVKTGLDKYNGLNVTDVALADFDNDGDTDVLVTLNDFSLKLLRNDGGNANNQLKLRLTGTRSNASALGVKVEVSAGGLRLQRIVTSLPVEIGVGKHTSIDAITVGWFDLTLSTVDVKVEPHQIELQEIYFPKGSCPYMYVWDGAKFRFVSDFLGNAPLGLRINRNYFADADTDEHLKLGDESNVKPTNGFYVIQVTEELSEALYLDEAKLVVVDHPAGTVAHSTSKMLPGPPFPPSNIILLHKPMPLIKATRDDGQDLTQALAKIDEIMAGPSKLRVPQLRGLAEPYSLILDFGLIPENRPIVLALTGWIKFGGGMANVAASTCPDLPFPFPQMEALSSDGKWVKVDVNVGVPSGKTKTIVVDLTGKLPRNTRLLKLTTAYEIYWDFICLYEKADQSLMKITVISPDSAHLHWRGYSNFKNLPPWLPLTPDYYDLHNEAPWEIIPMGWCTRYGEVVELIEKRDNALAIVNGGDELTIKFDAKKLPDLLPNYVRDYFIFTVGWDKDTDHHVECGTTVEPIPWHGMDYQKYGKQERPKFESDYLMKKYTTRWTGGPVKIKKIRLSQSSNN